MRECNRCNKKVLQTISCNKCGVMYCINCISYNKKTNITHCGNCSSTELTPPPSPTTMSASYNARVSISELEIVEEPRMPEPNDCVKNCLYFWVICLTCNGNCCVKF
jgi:hypothetical protein